MCSMTLLTSSPARAALSRLMFTAEAIKAQLLCLDFLQPSAGENFWNSVEKIE